MFTLLVSLSGVGGGGVAHASPVVERQLDHLARVGLTAGERLLVGPKLEVYVTMGGRLDQSRRVLETAMRWGCRGACLAAAVGGVNAGLRRDLTDDQAADFVLYVVAREVRDSAPADPLVLANRVRVEVRRLLADPAAD